MENIKIYIKKNKISSFLLFCIIVCTLLLFVVDQLDYKKVHHLFEALQQDDFKRLSLQFNNEEVIVSEDISEILYLQKILTDFEWKIHRSNTYKDDVRDAFKVTFEGNSETFLMDIYNEHIFYLVYDNAIDDIHQNYYLEMKWSKATYEKLHDYVLSKTSKQ